MKWIRKLSDAAYAVERALVFILFSLMVILIILGVVFRYFLHSPLSWSDEFALYALVWITFIGGSMSIKTKKAAAVSFVMERIPSLVSKWLVGIGSFLTLLFSLFLLYTSIKWITNPIVLLQKSPAGGFPMLIPYLAIPLGFLFISLHALDIFASKFNKALEESE